MTVWATSRSKDFENTLRKIIDRRFTNCYKKGDGGYWIWQAGCKGGAQYFSSLIS